MKIPVSWLKEYVDLPDDFIDKLTSVGHMFDKSEEIDGETVIDFELRGNRADCYSIFGIAREIAAIYGTKIKPLSVIGIKKGNITTKLSIKTPLVKRAGMVEVKNVKITESPQWLSQKLKLVGIDSINNIVDLTNYVMIETGEPTHAFDLDKIENNLEIRLAKKGEEIVTFQGVTLQLTDEDLVWAKDNQVLSIAGSIGEKYNSISDKTKNVLLEAANYERANIRRTVYRHKLFTEAGIRHEKELDPEMVKRAIERYLYFIKKHNWGKFEPIMSDYYPHPPTKRRINIDWSQIERLGGVKIDKAEIVNILKRLSFEINGTSVAVPSYRTDVSLPEDVAEEVLRIYSYDKIPAKILSLEIPKNVTPEYINQEKAIKNAATGIGFDEIISLSFVKEKYLNQNIPPSGTKVISIQNPPSPDTQHLRSTLLPNLLEQAQKVVHERGLIVQFFEIGKIYFRKKNYTEKRKIGLIYWKESGSKFTDFKSLLLGFFTKANITELVFTPEILNLELSDSYLIKIGKKEIGFGGSVNNMYYAEIDLDSILGNDKKYKISLWPKFPPQIEDITFIIPEKTYIGTVASEIKSVSRLITKVELADIYNNAYTFNIEYQHPEKTLTDREVGEIRKEILAKIKSKFGAIP